MRNSCHMIHVTNLHAAMRCSYSNFSIESARLRESTVLSTGVIELDITINTTGPAGDCVVQVYFQQLSQAYVRYDWNLLDFEKVREE